MQVNASISNNVSKLSKRSDVHTLRKVWHMSTGAIGLFLYLASGVDQYFCAAMLMGFAIFGFAIDHLRAKYQALNNLVIKYMGALMRESEANGNSGLPFYALGISLSLFMFNESVALISIMFLIFSDPISSYVGVNFGKDKILPNKSLQGALAGFVVCYLIALFSLHDSGASALNVLLFSVLGGVIGSVSELASASGIDDNLTIPVISGLGLTIINQVFVVL